jgi:hypothetical protein
MDAIHRTIDRNSGIQFSLHSGSSRGASGRHASSLPRVMQVLALALSFEDMIASGAAVNYEELARWAGVTSERLSQVMKLIWLAPAIQEEILSLPGCGGRHPLTDIGGRR